MMRRKKASLSETFLRGDLVLIAFGSGTQVGVYWSRTGEISHAVYRYSGSKKTFGRNPSRIHDKLLLGKADGDARCRKVLQAWSKCVPA